MEILFQIPFFQNFLSLEWVDSFRRLRHEDIVTFD